MPGMTARQRRNGAARSIVNVSSSSASLSSSTRASVITPALLTRIVTGPSRLGDRRDELVRSRRRAEVGAHRDRVAKPCRELLGRGAAAVVVHGHGRLLRGKLLAHGAADPARAPGDERDAQRRRSQTSGSSRCRGRSPRSASSRSSTICAEWCRGTSLLAPARWGERTTLSSVEQRAVRRERLLRVDVERGACDPLLAQRVGQRVVVGERGASGVDDVRGRLERGEHLAPRRARWSRA